MPGCPEPADSDIAQLNTVALRQIDATLRYYMKLSAPEQLADTAWAQQYCDLVWIRYTERRQSEKESNSLKKARKK